MSGKALSRSRPSKCGGGPGQSPHSPATPPCGRGPGAAEPKPKGARASRLTLLLGQSASGNVDASPPPGPQVAEAAHRVDAVMACLPAWPRRWISCRADPPPGIAVAAAPLPPLRHGRLHVEALGRRGSWASVANTPQASPQGRREGVVRHQPHRLCRPPGGPAAPVSLSLRRWPGARSWFAKQENQAIPEAGPWTPRASQPPTPGGLAAPCCPWRGQGAAWC